MQVKVNEALDEISEGIKRFLSSKFPQMSEEDKQEVADSISFYAWVQLHQLVLLPLRRVLHCTVNMLDDAELQGYTGKKTGEINDAK